MEEGEIGGHPVRLLRVPGRRLVSAENDGMYPEYEAPAFEAVGLTFIPYVAWANRGEGEMDVWVRT